jgi:hypothetical protein
MEDIALYKHEVHQQDYACASGSLVDETATGQKRGYD